MIDEALRSLIAFVESASPIVWQAAQQEVAVQIVINTRAVWLFAMLGVLFLILTVVSFFNNNSPYSDWGLVAGGSVFIAVCCFIIAFVCWNQITALQMNPEYQAIKIIAKLVTGGN